MARKQRRKYTPEFRAEAVALVVEGGVSQSQVARDLGILQCLLSKWVQKAKVAALPGALTAAEREELRQLRRENNILRQERDILKSGGRLREGDIVGRYRFIAAEKAANTWSVRRMCAALKLSRAGFYAWESEKRRLRDEENARLTVHIRTIHRRSRETYGAPRVMPSSLMRVGPLGRTAWPG